MKRLQVALALGAILTLAAPARAGDRAITVFAAASLREAFQAAAPAFARKTGIAVTYSFGGSDELVTQLRQGAPADVYASANEAQMTIASEAGLLAAPARTFARNRLVLIVPKDDPAKIAGIADVARPGVKVVLAAAAVPVGAYARAAFKRLDGVAGFPRDFAALVERNVVSNELDVKAVATKIALGEGDAGVVYTTDVTPSIAPKVRTFAFPPGASPDAVYPIAALKAAPDPAGARAFVDFVLSPEGQSFLRARGFQAP
jgi:molybdate transport system substrate-binding protein